MQNMWSLNLLHGPLGCLQIQLFAVNIDEKLDMCAYIKQNEWGQCISDTQTTHMMKLSTMKTIYLV